MDDAVASELRGISRNDVIDVIALDLSTTDSKACRC
jgi:hypothetical protein